MGKKDKYGDHEWLLFCCSVFFNGGRTKVGGLNLKVIGFSLVESTVAFSFDPTWLVLAVGTLNHGPRAELWVLCWRWTQYIYIYIYIYIHIYGL